MEPAPKDPRKIDYKDIDNWVRSRGAQVEDCPVCGKEKSLLPPTRGLGFIDVPRRDQAVTGRFALVAGYTCRNCGYVQLHAPGMLQETQ